MNKSESKFFQSFKERTGKNASKLTVAGKPKARRTKSTTNSQGAHAKSSAVAELRASFEALKRNYLDLREKSEAEGLELRRQLFEERETSKRLRKRNQIDCSRKSKMILAANRCQSTNSKRFLNEIT